METNQTFVRREYCVCENEKRIVNGKRRRSLMKSIELFWEKEKKH